jgi:16S rRNA (cytosine1402-N4)-methyltransferase
VVEAEAGFHRPVMVEEALAQLRPATNGEIMDCTVGGGGHSRALLQRYPECRILAVDRDPRALEAARVALAPFEGRVTFRQLSFDDAAREAGAHGPRLSGALLDLGMSTHQLDQDERGFSFRQGVFLDMRMGGDTVATATASDLLNDLDESELGRIFREFGEERHWRRLAKAVVLLRGDRPLRTSDDLVAALSKALRRPPTVKEKARAFQALRIAVNRELDSLAAALPALLEALLPGGVIVVISYESLMDRLVKETFRDWSRDCVCPPGLPTCVCRGRPLGSVAVKGVIRPSPSEIEENPRARSARMRSWRKAA